MLNDFEKHPPLGIDLGTTFSAIARWNGTSAETYTIRGSQTFQSVVFYDEKNAKYLTDRLAYGRTVVDPDCGIIGVKRKMDNRDERIRLGSREHSPIEISAKILGSIYRAVADMYPAGTFSSRGVVVTVPYYFKAHQYVNTREAADMAGLNCIAILQEPIAASLQYALQTVRDHPQEERDDTMLVFDLGGGTFDLTLFQLRLHKDKLWFEVLACAGDDRLGGLDFDEALMNYVLRVEGLSFENVEPKLARRARQKLLERAMQAKEVLSFSEDADLIAPEVLPGRHVERNLSRAEFLRLLEPFMSRIERCMEDLFNRAGVRPGNVTRVIKVGGSSKIPAMANYLRDVLGGDKVYGNIKEDLCIAEGAAIYAAYLDDRDVLGREIEITTRTSHALGIEIAGGQFHELIPANRKTPCSRMQVFAPEKPGQREISIDVYQGSARVAKQNTKVGTIPIPLAGTEEKDQDIEVTFTLDAEQCLTVKVQVKDGTGRIVRQENCIFHSN